jgi:hypothetical protein
MRTSWVLNQTPLDCISSDIEPADGLTISTCLAASGLSSKNKSCMSRRAQVEVLSAFGLCFASDATGEGD